MHTRTVCEFPIRFPRGKYYGDKSPLLLYAISFKELLSKVLNEHGYEVT